MGIFGLFSKKQHPQNGPHGLAVPELETAIKQLTLDRARLESTFAIKDAELEELRFRRPKEYPLQNSEDLREILSLRIAKFEEKLVEEQKRNAVCDAALVILPYQLAAAEIKSHEIGLELNTEDLDREFEKLEKESNDIAKKIGGLKEKIEIEEKISPACRRAIFIKKK